MGRGGPRPIRCGLYIVRSALPMTRPTCLGGPVQAAAQNVFYGYYYCHVYLTLPVRRPICFDGPARATAIDTWCTIVAATTSAHADLLLVVLAQMPYHGFGAVAGVEKTLEDTRGHSLPSPRHGQHFTFSPSFGPDETAGANFVKYTPSKGTPSDRKLQRRSPLCMSLSNRQREVLL